MVGPPPAAGPPRTGLLVKTLLATTAQGRPFYSSHRSAGGLVSGSLSGSGSTACEDGGTGGTGAPRRGQYPGSSPKRDSTTAPKPTTVAAVPRSSPNSEIMKERMPNGHSNSTNGSP